MQSTLHPLKSESHGKRPGCAIFVASALLGTVAIGAGGKRANSVFEIAFSEEGITTLKRKDDAHDTNYIASGRALGADVEVRYRANPQQPWGTLQGKFRAGDEPDGTIRLVAGDPDQLRVTQEFVLADDHLDWTITLANQADTALEIGDLAVPMVFAEDVPKDRGDIYTKKLIRHSFLSGHGSWIYWSRANAEGPYLVMATGQEAKFEYFDDSADAFTPYIHGSVASQEPIAKAKSFGGGAEPWRFPLTTLSLSAEGSAGSMATYRFRFRFAEDSGAVREVLYDENLFDVHILPGMSLPLDLPAMISLRTKIDISDVEAEFPDRTEIEYLGEKGPDNHIYRVKFSRLGENMLRVRYGDQRWMSLEFFIMEPLETVIQKRARFLTETQQHDDPGKPWHGAYGDWDQINKVLRNPEDRDGMRPWLVDSSDDAGNARPAFIAAKNVFLPVPSEIAGVERYIRYYLWNDLKDGKGGMQMTENEKYPYGIYGTFDNWWGHRASDDPGRNGRAHLWRIYDYPHIIQLYYRMYQIATYYPDLVKWRNAEQYLELAYRTAKAYWEVPLEIENWSADSVGTMGEAFLPELIDVLSAEGKTEWSEDLRRRWEGKVARFIRDTPNLYGSEFAFDSTGFESTQAFARYALERRDGLADRESGAAGFGGITKREVEEFARLQMDLNVCVRGWLETSYYQLGSDYRVSMSYLLSYMSHLGGWAVLDRAIHTSGDPSSLLRLGYASSLSAWAMVNSGTEETDYGYWYPGKENDGGAGGGFVPEAWGRGWIGKQMPRGAWYYSAEEDVGFVGALRAHCSILTDDPLFGEVALGGELKRDGDLAMVVPRDGLGARFQVIRGDQRLKIVFERDRFARNEPITVSDSMDRLEFTAASRGGPDHPGTVFIVGLPAGTYTCSVNGKPIRIHQGGNGERKLKLPMSASETTAVRLARTE